MATLSQWVHGARPRTLPAAVAPIAVGTAAAHTSGTVVWGYALLALVVAAALQVGVNYANDYSDGIRGTDEVRVGPIRLVGQRLADPQTVKFAAFACFGFAALCGLALVALSGIWWMVPVGAASVLAAWYYTGGTRPYGYLGFGEVFVFLFFGLVATLGTMATMAPVTKIGWYGAVGVGALATAILVANNLRDIPTDREHGKQTLAVRLGDQRTRLLYAALFAVAVVMTVLIALTYPFALLALAAGVLAYAPLRTVLGGATGRYLVPALGGTGYVELAWSLLLALGLWISSR